MKIYFHWGIGLIISLITFIIFIIYLAFIYPSISSQLISDSYYEEEINYQNIINERNNANSLLRKVFIEIIPKGIKIHFPKIFNSNNTKGNFYLLRPSNKFLDIKKSFNLDIYSNYTIPKKILHKGLYILIIKWNSNNKKYFIEKFITWKS